MNLNFLSKYCATLKGIRKPSLEQMHFNLMLSNNLLANVYLLIKTLYVGVYEKQNLRYFYSLRNTVKIKGFKILLFKELWPVVVDLKHIVDYLISYVVIVMNTSFHNY